jgi:hypothetical protein
VICPAESSRARPVVTAFIDVLRVSDDGIGTSANSTKFKPSRRTKRTNGWKNSPFVCRSFWLPVARMLFALLTMS